MNTLVGYTGFVGSNLYKNGTFDAVYNSKNIRDAYGTRPDLLIYAGLRAEKYLANNAPEKDMELILQAEENITKIAPKQLVLISTIDVFKSPKGVDECSPIDSKGLHPYGYNRYQLEKWTRKIFPEALIIRLPGLFGDHIKKNFLYDYIRVVPSVLKAEKMDELCAINPLFKNYYSLWDDGLYKLNELTAFEYTQLKERFMQVGFTALNFTDSRSRYQFYNLKGLWNDIQIALKNGITLWHPATEPISAGELYKYLSGNDFINELDGVPADYDFRTIYAELFGGEKGYISGKESILRQIDAFIKSQVQGRE